MTSNLSPAQKALSGAIASVAANTIVYPLDLVKTIIQTQDKSDGQYKNTLDCLSKLYKKNGISSLYSGLSSSLVGTALQNFYYFYWYSILKDVYVKLPKKSAKDKKIADELIIGILAACVTQVFITPINVITTKQQTENDDKESSKDEIKWRPENKCLNLLLKNSMVRTAAKIIETDGVEKLWNGLKVSLVLSLNPSITYGSYERLKALFFKDKEYLNPAQSFNLGLLSKIIATLITQPLIVSKANLQKSGQYKNFQMALITIYKKEGIRGLWKGLLPQISKASLVQGFLFMFKEQFDLFLLFLIAVIKSSVHRKKKLI